jgi:hypothetical protein
MLTLPLRKRDLMLKYLPLLLISLAFFSACESNSNTDDSESSNAAKPELERTQRNKLVDARFDNFEIEEGVCAADDSIYIELGSGKGKQFASISAYAHASIPITSLKGDVVNTREGSGYSLFLGDYVIDPLATGENPDPTQSKLEFTFITQDKSPIAPGVYGTSKTGNLSCGPNLFHDGKTYPMKDNFIGGVKITSVSEDKICGEIRVKSKFQVAIIGKFEAPIVPAPQ